MQRPSQSSATAKPSSTARSSSTKPGTMRFANTARVLGDAARRRGYTAPSFRSPPRLEGRMRTIRRHDNGAATVSLVFRGRPWTAVVADMIEGFVAVNGADEAASEKLRDMLWATVEHGELVAVEPVSGSAEVAALPESQPLRVVDDAA